MSTKRYLAYADQIENNHDYDGKNLKEIFGTAANFMAALRAGNFDKIHVGDYWPITLTGNYSDYGSFKVPAGVTYYSDAALTTAAGTTASVYDGWYQSDSAVAITVSGATKYVATSDCENPFPRSFNNAAVKFEVAGINHFYQYGDSGDLTAKRPSLVMVSRDCLPQYFRFRQANQKWYDESELYPWGGSHLYQTLNNPTDGIIKLVEATDIGAYIYAGPQGKGMRMYDIKTTAVSASPATGGWVNRGKLWLPTECEVWGEAVYQQQNVGILGDPLQFELFRGSRRHIMKGAGDGGSRYGWWLSSPSGAAAFALVSYTGTATGSNAYNYYCVPLCFILT